MSVSLLCCSVHKFHLYCSCERFVLRDEVLLTDIKVFAIRMMTVLLEYIKLLVLFRVCVRVHVCDYPTLQPACLLPHNLLV